MWEKMLMWALEHPEAGISLLGIVLGANSAIVVWLRKRVKDERSVSTMLAGAIQTGRKEAQLSGPALDADWVRRESEKRMADLPKGARKVLKKVVDVVKGRTPQGFLALHAFKWLRNRRKRRAER